MGLCARVATQASGGTSVQPSMMVAIAGLVLALLDSWFPRQADWIEHAIDAIGDRLDLRGTPWPWWVSAFGFVAIVITTPLIVLTMLVVAPLCLLFHHPMPEGVLDWAMLAVMGPPVLLIVAAMVMTLYIATLKSFSRGRALRTVGAVTAVCGLLFEFAR